MYTVSVLYSASCEKRYVGQTDDLARRLAEPNDPDHNRRKFTSRNPGPWVLVHSEEFATRAEAMAREKWLKSGVGRERLSARPISRASPPPAD